MTLTEDLIALYRVDSQLRGLRSRVENASDILQRRERRRGEVKSTFEEAESRHRQMQAHLQNLEGDTADLNDRIEKLRTELNACTTDKQYQAILGEMKSLQSQRDEVETAQIADMERLEAVGREIEELGEQLGERDRLVEVAVVEKSECENAVSERMGELETERSAAAKQVPERVLKLFDEVADQHEGETLAPVVEVSKRHREYSCGACHVQMPYYLVVNLHSGDGAVQQCPNCNRILYLEPSEAEA